MLEFNSLLQQLSSFSFSTIHFVVALIAFLETRRSVGMLIPASICLFLIGSLSPFYAHSWLSLALVASVSAMSGDNLNYYLSQRDKKRSPIYRYGLLSKRDLKKTDDFYAKWKILSPLFGRMIPGRKEVIPLVVSRHQFPYFLFVILNAVGSLLWGVFWLGSGYYLALWLNLANFWLSQSSLLIPFILTTLLFLYSTKWFIQRYGWILSIKIGYLLKRLGRQISLSPYYKLWRYRNPSIYLFLKSRFDPTKFSGLTTSLFLLIILYLFLLFSGITEDFLSGDSITRVDTHIANLFVLLRADWLTTFMIWVTQLGTAPVVSLVLITSSALLWTSRKPIYILPLWLSGISVVTITFLGKFIFHRNRPPLPVYQEISYSFPSAHASISIGLYGFLAYILIRHSRDWTQKVNYAYSALILILLIGFSRVYLGVHYLSDIISGYLLGGLFLTIGIAITEWLKKQYPIKSALPNTLKQNAIFALIGLTSISLFIFFGMTFKPTPNESHIEVPPQFTSIHELFSDPARTNTETIVGSPQAPINIIFLTSDERQIDTAFTNAGWVKTAPMTLNSLEQLLMNQNEKLQLPPPAFPMFWQSHIQRVSYIKPKTSLNPEQQIWIWYAGKFVTKNESMNVQNIYVGMTHQIKTQTMRFIPDIYPDLNQARNLLMTDLESNVQQSNITLMTISKQTIGKTIWNSLFYSDGQVAIIHLPDLRQQDE